MAITVQNFNHVGHSGMIVEEGTSQHKVDGPNRGFNWTVLDCTERGGAGSRWLEEADLVSHQKMAMTEHKM